MIKRVAIWECALVLLLSAACTKEGNTIYVPDPADAADDSPLVTVIYDPDALGDMAYNDLIYAGVERAAGKYGLRTMQLSPRTREEGLSYLSSVMQQMCAETDTVRRLLVVAGSSYDDYVRSNNSRLEAHPRSDLLYFETTQPLSGKGSSVHINFYGAMYEAGAFTPIFSPEVLLVGANPQDASVATALAGFRDGFAKDYIEDDDEKKVFQVYLSQKAGEGYTIADSTALRLMYTQPWEAYTRMIVPVCGGGGATFRRLAENTILSFKVMGMDRVVLSTCSLYTAVKHSDNAVEHCIDQWLSAEGMPKHQTLGLADGFTEMEFHPVDKSLLDLFNQMVPLELRQTIHKDAIEKEAQYGK